MARGSLHRVPPQGSVRPMAPPELSESDKAILDCERSWWTEPGPKEAEVRDRFDLSGTSYYRILNELLASPAALAYDPLVVRRLRRLRDRRRRARFEGSVGEHRAR